MIAQQESLTKELFACPECGSSSFVETISDLVCRKCGLVLEQRIESTHFLDKGEEGTRYGSPESRRCHSTFFITNEAKPGEKREKYKRMWYTENSSYDAIDEQKSRILSILTKLGLTTNQKNDILYELRKMYNDEKRNGNKVTNIFLLASALTIRYMKNKKLPVSIRSVVDIFKSYGCKLSAKAVRDYIISNNIAYKCTDPSLYVSKYMAKLRNNYEIRAMLKTVAEDEIGVDKILTTIERIATKLSSIDPNGRRPSVLSVSCIYLATELLGQKMIGSSLLSKKQLSELCNVPSTTMRAHCNYLKNQINIKI
ncbi:MAG: TFIIB-type zinc ribbon-containing protein [Candidatus Heimdallarchaeaceae archaeon]